MTSSAPQYRVGQRVRIERIDMEGWQGRDPHPMPLLYGEVGTIEGLAEHYELEDGVEEPTDLYYVRLNTSEQVYVLVDYELSPWEREDASEGDSPAGWRQPLRCEPEPSPAELARLDEERPRLATPELSGREAVTLILDAAETAPDSSLEGLALALGSILSADERPASELIAAARRPAGAPEAADTFFPVCGNCSHYWIAAVEPPSVCEHCGQGPLEFAGDRDEQEELSQGVISWRERSAWDASA